ncbi:MAG: pyruvate ferredoxin oxidoreductase [Chloroflexi bacterium]|nr:pyruvate ferredoxin oxidoreductase [Chloroflexota bacterium]
MALVTRHSRLVKEVRGTPVALDGATLVAYAMRQVRPDVVAAYPITPQTVITEAFSEFVANGEVETEFIQTESEHAALSACIGASAAGGRVQTATSGPGLALMWEVMYVASGNRLPIVMHLCARALSAPLNILCDHSDVMGIRDAGWVILLAETAQEAYDNAIQAVRIAEHPEVMLPVASVMDGFITTHGVERSEVLPDEAVAEFVGTYRAPYSILDVAHPVTVGPLDFHDFYFEHKRQQIEAMERAREVVCQVAEEYGTLTGRCYGAVEPYRMEDAEVATLVIGSVAGTLRTVVDDLRRQGIRAGMVKLRCFRPFPGRELAALLGGVGVVGILDRSISPGGAGHPLFTEVSSALCQRGCAPRMRSFVYGLGGRTPAPAQFRQAYGDLLADRQLGAEASAPVYLGLRE